MKSFNEFVNDSVLETVNVNTTKYMGVHGKSPKGWGMWVFKIGDKDVPTPKAMSYTDAVKWASAEAKKEKINLISVLG